MKPMLAADIGDQLDKLRFPVYATPKLDGVRAIIRLDGVYSRSLKKIPHKTTQDIFHFREPKLRGLDGELIVGPPTAPDVYRRTQSVVATAESVEVAKFYAFDLFHDTDESYGARLDALRRLVDDVGNFYVVPVEAVQVRTMDELIEVENCFLNRGYEGLILRAPEGKYKYGRSTVREQGMLKLKRFTDSEAEVIGFEEEMHNGNEAKTGALGRTERSSHKANLSGKERMGALIVRDLTSKVEFKIGTGFTAADRDWFWRDRDGHMHRNTVVKYKHFAIGAKDKPRFPTYVGLREGWDR